MKAVGFELKQAARRVFTWKQTGAIMIPAIGLALATIMFAVGWSYSSLSLPYKDAGKLVVVKLNSIPGVTVNRAQLDGDYSPLFAWKERKDVFIDVAAARRMTDLWMFMTVNSNKGGVSLDIREVTTNFFDMLGVSFPGIQAWKEAANVKNPKTVVFPYKTGADKFGFESMGEFFPAQERGGGGIIASGILPRNFILPITTVSAGDDYAFTPMELRPGDHGNIQKSRNLDDGTSSESARDPITIFARLAPGVTPQTAERKLAGNSDGVYTNSLGEKGRISISPIRDIIASPSKPIVRYAWALCALILVLCAANLGGILLARCTYRLREYALCAALGATLSNLVRTLLLELCGIAAIAALIASHIARTAMPYIADRVPVRLEAFGRPVFNRETMIFLIAAAAAVMFASAASSIAVMVRHYYKGFTQGILAVFRSHRALRISLTAGQTAIATLLLCISWITVRGYSDIFFRDTGVDKEVRVISIFYPSLNPNLAPTANEMEQLLGRSLPETYAELMEFYSSDFYREITRPPFDIIDTLNVFRGGNPNARSALSITSNLFARWRIYINGDKYLTKADYPDIPSSFALDVSPGFFQTLGVKIIAGRDFNDNDINRRELIVNETLVRKMGWPPWEAVGKEIREGIIIGVAADFLVGPWDGEISPEIFTPVARPGTRTPLPIHYVIHPDDLRRAGGLGNIEKAIRGFDPEARITKNVSWSESLGATVRGRSFTTLCIALFTAVAIAIVVIGIVGTITFIVARRMRDIAIQIAVGAPSYRVCWFVVKDMVIAGVIGALIGGIASWWAGKAVAHYIYNGEKYQNLTGLAIATVIMLAIIAAAALLPAWRATRIEPGRILNME